MDNVKPRKFTVKIFRKFLGIEPGLYKVVQSKKGYRMFLTENTWIGFPREVVENNPKQFREVKLRPKTQSYV